VNSFRKIWGEASAWLYRKRRLSWVDLLILVGLAGLLYGIIDFAQESRAPHQSIPIDLSPLALPRYTFYSLTRGLIAYVLSLLFTLVYGYWAAKDRVAERVLVPLLDILQSIPVLSFLPGLVLALDALFPENNVGLEMAAILMIFTGQAWNMTFSFFHSVKSVPDDQREAATVYRFSWWQRFKWVELPFSMMGLVWNSMMSMAGGWFFLMVSEAFELRGNSYQLPGVGSYMSRAVEANDLPAMICGILAMVLMIVLLDQLLWRPVVVWAQKFRVEEGGEAPVVSSWFLDWLRRSRLLRWLHTRWQARRRRTEGSAPAEKVAVGRLVERQVGGRAVGDWLSLAVFLALLGVLGYGAVRLAMLLAGVSGAEWAELPQAALATLLRVLASTAIGTLWAVPAGLAIGLSPRLSRALQPVVQVAASFPAPMLFPLVIKLLHLAHVTLNWGSVLLMLMGTQWYILFNVIAGTMAIPADLREMSRSYDIRGWRRFRKLYLPAIFPYLVTGWVTAAGGAWNASIVSEYSQYAPADEPPAFGIGAIIAQAPNAGQYALLAASTLVMAVFVVVFNRTVWRRMYRLAESKYSLSK
jgi:NitT/TauT family transport system permease protein